MEVIDSGWDSRAWLLDGGWIERQPRRPEVAERLLTETRLLPWLAPQVPLAVPVPVVVAETPLRVRHRLVPGRPLPPDATAHASALGSFLRALHSADVAAAAALGVPDAATSHRRLVADLDRLGRAVLPRLERDERPPAAALLEAAARPWDDIVLVHGDLGPDHVLVEGDRLSGIIDWSDAHVGDPAIDLAWLLHGTSPGFAAALLEPYGGPPDRRTRSLVWHRLGPWHEVLYGVEQGQPDLVLSGLAGVRARLAPG